MENEKHIKIGDKIKIHFEGKLESGEIFESSFGKKPLHFKVGEGNVIQGIDEAVVGMKKNQQKMIHITSDKAYGSVEKELIISIKKEDLPDTLELKIDQKLYIPFDDGQPMEVRISNINEEYIEFDGNHPLAGKNLIFNLEIVDID